MKTSDIVTWEIEIPYENMKPPFQNGDRILHFGQRVEIIKVERRELKVIFTAIPTQKALRISL